MYIAICERPEVITIAFRDVVNDDGVLPEPTRKLLFSTFDPIYDFHCSFLSELEKRMTLWDVSGASKTEEKPRMGDLVLRNMKQIKRYLHHLKRHDQVMLELEDATTNFKDFEVAYKEFETQKVCYLPFNAFILKPSQRIVHYKFLLERLLKLYPAEHIDYQDTQSKLNIILLYLVLFLVLFSGTFVHSVSLHSFEDPGSVKP
ncbi:FERM, ARHGEF and pleckstrin domain-containing protein 1 [Desmophyllum pertusum]|uniref:FERM, ARHGEF and pleckstrin domain-containing protein 1 n=1 Tax=Desmophyllum pertusum TaxID=174260 RepID=A0A9X0CDA0_9CNID|nr:FERM, ARHGEF and pleckstrin domain-containing protein 1 [Desmophyllum pertusum]